MALKIFNTLSKQEEEFVPIEDNKVKMYVCGVTVYDDIHMGHARSIIVFDMIDKYLRYRGYDVTHLTNFTDVDDKIINRAAELGIDPLQLSRNYIDRYLEDIDRLGVRRADAYPKASENIDQIICMIEKIIANGYGYVADDGSVYFSVEAVSDYGRLTGQKLEDMQAGARIDVNESKRNPYDFALWKAAKPGEISWTSPWGEGRPGWHIECSAMCTEYLGETIDIHGGGNDLIFPHHENEILQSEAANKKPLANYWIHNGMLQVQDAKMSKSLKNFFTLRDIMEKYSKEEIRFYVLSAHYRGPQVYSESALDEAAASLKRITNVVRELRDSAGKFAGTEDADRIAAHFHDKFIESMDQDFNSRAAISELFELVKETNKLISSNELSNQGAENILSVLEEMDSVFGILPVSASENVSDDLIQILVDVRSELRKLKQYTLADSIRDRLKECGIELQDSAEGVKWIHT
ncbi:cysteine--tRNA ligase [Candidatus Methanomassiliicoccus intestinalis]|uniref:cysteine--tRNA ligase n=2 Tax=Candidatus Methanomassiliicoccus intestinalis TaxID=1406512 RepID=UPI0037DC9409|nr:MAG: cysteine--tRNA ligase [Candidatus Methanomassiliicoccus intestinalis]